MLEAFSLGRKNATGSVGTGLTALAAGLVSMLAGWANGNNALTVTLITAFSSLIAYLMIAICYGVRETQRLWRERQTEIKYFNSPMQTANRFRALAFKKGKVAAQEVNDRTKKLDYTDDQLRKLSILGDALTEALLEIRTPYRGSYHYDLTVRWFSWPNKQINIYSLVREVGLELPSFNYANPPCFGGEPQLEEYIVKMRDSFGPQFSDERIESGRKEKRDIVRSLVEGYTIVLSAIKSREQILRGVRNNL